MNLDVIIASVASAGIVGLLNWLFSQPSKHKEAMHELDKRLTSTEVKLDGMGNRVTRTEESIEDIRENMVRKEDLIALKEDLKSYMKG